MGFPQGDQETDVISSCSKSSLYSNPVTPSDQHSKFSSQVLERQNLQSISCLQSVPEFEHEDDSQNLIASVKSSQIASVKSSQTLEMNKHYTPLLNSTDEDAAMNQTQQYVSFEEYQNRRFKRTSSWIHSLKQPQDTPLGVIPINQRNSIQSRAMISNTKTRIRWNQELHKRFVECVNHLGGAESK